MEKTLNKRDLDFILESLQYTKLNFENSEKYPDYQFRQQRLKDINDVIDKVKNLKKSFGGG